MYASSNRSGEEYEHAQVRLVVGAINLVQKIAALATTTAEDRMAGQKPRVKDDLMKGIRVLADGLDVSNADGDTDLYGLGQSQDLALGYFFSAVPKNIEKQTLGDYFLYTIEGTETIPTGWSKRLRSFEAADVKFDIQYRYRPAEYGDRLVRMLILTNNADAKLGKTPLPDGVARVYRENGREGLAFLGSQELKYVPIGQKIELNLGADPQVIHEWVKLKTWRDDFWFKVPGFDVYRSLNDGISIEANNEVAGWRDHVRHVERIRNYRDKPIDVEIRRAFNGHAVFASKQSPAPILHDFQTVQMTAACPARTRTELPYHLTTLQGCLAKQAGVTLQAGD